jgi:bifunctional non-homologous end joining protein LigD
MMARPVPKSRRQYVQGVNTPTKELLRKLKGAEPGALPKFVEPLLPMLREKPPVGPNWVHEIKFDGYRFQIRLWHHVAQILTRRGHDWTRKAREVAAAASTLSTDSALIDGEAVVMAEDGTTDFNELERELGKGDSDRITFHAFDLLYFHGHDLRRVPLLDRKRLLRALLADLPQDSPIRYSDHLEGDALGMKLQACELGLEGIVSKLKDSRYVAGHSDLWAKTPCRTRETYAIVGYALKGKRFDGFYLGEERKEKLEYAGKIESGWTEKEKIALFDEVKSLRTDRSSLSKIDKPKAVWVEPRILVDVEYRAKTKKGGLLRHPSFKGVRRDLMDRRTKSSRRRRDTRKDPDEWVSGDEPMTGVQASYLKTLSEQADDPTMFEEGLTKAEASKRIDELRNKLNVGTA